MKPPRLYGSPFDAFYVFMPFLMAMAGVGIPLILFYGAIF